MWSETGTEGGYWAFQNNKHISWVAPSYGISNDLEVRDINDPNRLGIVSDDKVHLNQEWLPFPDPIIIGPDFLISSLNGGEKKGELSVDLSQNALTRVTVKWNDGTTEYQRKSNTLLVEQWDHSGLRVLKSGDKLKILHPAEKIPVWEGIVELKLLMPFTEKANGFWIRADQTGISRKEWSKYFFNKFPALLEVN